MKVNNEELQKLTINELKMLIDIIDLYQKNLIMTNIEDEPMYYTYLSNLKSSIFNEIKNKLSKFFIV